MAFVCIFFKELRFSRNMDKTRRSADKTLGLVTDSKLSACKTVQMVFDMFLLLLAVEGNDRCFTWDQKTVSTDLAFFSYIVCWQTGHSSSLQASRWSVVLY